MKPGAVTGRAGSADTGMQRRAKSAGDGAEKVGRRKKG
ncbi:hypothetical protein ASZ90_016028 [hydrocarbon metagenome]|uniref:Uncharacterized protein n=1 Tax=hydrocarbon metagenome TaxID=938273 RepID=A0A0W8F0F2_9ZZZZ